MMLSPSLAQAGKDYGQQLTLDANVEWKDHVMVELRAWIAKRKDQGATHMTMEEFRHVARNQPGTHKCWGAITTAAKNAGLLEFAGYVKAQSVKTHGHPVALWRLA